MENPPFIDVFPILDLSGISFFATFEDTGGYPFFGWFLGRITPEYHKRIKVFNSYDNSDLRHLLIN